MATNTWAGGASGDTTNWNNSANWSTSGAPTRVPTPADNVIIPNVTHDPTIPDSLNPTVLSIQVQSSAQLTCGNNTITVTDESGGYAFDVSGTLVPNASTVVLSSIGADTYIKVDNGSFNNLTINSSGDEINLGNDLTVGGNLTITAGELDILARELDVDGITTIGDGSASATEATLTCNASACSFGSGVTSGYAVIIEVGGEFVGGTGAHTMGSFKVAADNALAKATLSQGVTTINAKSNDSNKAFRIAGSSATFDDGNGTVKFTYAGTVLVQSSSKTFHNLTVDNGSCNLELVDALYVAETLLITNGTIDTKSGSSFGVQVTKHIDIHGTFTGRGSSISTGTMTIRDGATLANSGTITVTGEDVANSPSGGNWLWRQLEDDGTGFAPTAGTVHFNHASNLNGKHLNESKFYNLTLTAGTGHDVAWTPKTANTLTVSKDLTIVEGQLKRNNEADTFVVTEDVSIESGGVLGDNDETGPNTFGSLTIADGGTYKATSGTTTITSENGTKCFDNQSGGTFTHNNGTLKFASSIGDTTFDNAGADDFYNLTCETNGDCKYLNAITVLNNLTINHSNANFAANTDGSGAITVHGITKLVDGIAFSTSDDNANADHYGFIVIEGGTFRISDTSSATKTCDGIRNIGGTLSG